MKNVAQHTTLFSFNFYWSQWGSSWDLPAKMKSKGYILIGCDDSRNPRTNIFWGLPEDRFGLHYLLSNAVKEIVGDVSPTIDMVREFNNIYTFVFRKYRYKVDIKFLKKLPLSFYSEEDFNSPNCIVRGYIGGLSTYMNYDAFGIVFQLPIGGWTTYLRPCDAPKSSSVSCRRCIVKPGDSFTITRDERMVVYSDTTIRFRVSSPKLETPYEGTLYKAMSINPIIETISIYFY